MYCHINTVGMLEKTSLSNGTCGLVNQVKNIIEKHLKVHTAAYCVEVSGKPGDMQALSTTQQKGHYPPGNHHASHF